MMITENVISLQIVSHILLFALVIKFSVMKKITVSTYR